MSETTFFPKLRDEYESGRLFTPGNRFCFEAPGKKIMYVALDPRQKPPEHGIFRPEWISVEERLPEECEPVLLYIERNAWNNRGYRFRKHDTGVGWHVDGRWHVDGYSAVAGIAWMPLPDPPGE